MDDLQVFVNRVMRTILSVKLSDKISVETMMEITGIPSVNRLTIESILIEMWKGINFDLQYTDGRTVLERVIPGSRSEFEKLAHIPLQKKHLTKDWLPVKFGKAWNLATTEFRLCTNYICAKKLAKDIASNCPI